MTTERRDIETDPQTTEEREVEEQKVLGAAGAALGLGKDRLQAIRLPGHASARTYYRVRSGPRPTSTSVVVMVLPPEAGKGEEVGSDAVGEELPFITVQRYLNELGVRVPRILAFDEEQGLMVLEDLGDTTMEEALKAGGEPARKSLYGRAVDQLAFMRVMAERSPRPGELPFTRTFDYELLRWELDHFKEWLLEEDRKAVLGPAESAVVTGAFDEIATRLAGLPRGLTHRDYQSRNLMVIPGELAVIDFQDALMGPMVYDLVALLRDSYVRLDRSFIDSMLDRYCDARRALGGSAVDREELDAEFDLQTVQRKLKDAGRFIFIDRVKKNPDFLPNVGVSLSYVAEALSRMPEYRRLHGILASHVPELGSVG